MRRVYYTYQAKEDRLDIQCEIEIWQPKAIQAFVTACYANAHLRTDHPISMLNKPPSMEPRNQKAAASK